MISIAKLVSMRNMAIAAGLIIAAMCAWVVALKLDLAEADTKIARAERAIETARADAERSARRTERQLTEAFNDERDRLEQALNDATVERADAENTIADLLAGNRRLRDRFSCPAGGGSMPGAAISAGDAAGTGNRGFTAEDGAIALGIASDGDERINRLNARLEACLSILEAERSALNSSERSDRAPSATQ